MKTTLESLQDRLPVEDKAEIVVQFKQDTNL